MYSHCCCVCKKKNTVAIVLTRCSDIHLIPIGFGCFFQIYCGKHYAYVLSSVDSATSFKWRKLAPVKFTASQWPNLSFHWCTFIATLIGWWYLTLLCSVFLCCNSSALYSDSSSTLLKLFCLLPGQDVLICIQLSVEVGIHFFFNNSTKIEQTNWLLLANECYGCWKHREEGS